MSGPRFKVDRVTHQDRDGEWKNWGLIDTRTGEVVGADGGEPEDQLLVRDWDWVPALANRLAAEAEALTAEVTRLTVLIAHERDSFSAALEAGRAQGARDARMIARLRAALEAK